MADSGNPQECLTHYFSELLGLPSELSDTGTSTSMPSAPESDLLAQDKADASDTPQIESQTEAHEPDYKGASDPLKEMSDDSSLSTEPDDSLGKIEVDPTSESLTPVQPVQSLSASASSMANLSTFVEPDKDLLEDYNRRKLQQLLDQKILTDIDGQTELLTCTQEQTAVPEGQEHAGELDPSSAQFQHHFLSWNDNGRPEWAQERFDALLFTVGGLKLAVPLLVLGQIYPMDQKLTPLFGQQDWFMGIFKGPLANIHVIDTAMLVMPERYQAEMAKQVKYVISIDNFNWGLAVQAINLPIKLTPEDVSWRSQRTKRPWLAGTVKKEMCALIDIPQIAKIVSDYQE